MDFSPERLRLGALYLIALILSICVHEFGHAWVADRLGDPLPRAQGRVTLNPLAHIDPIGTLLMPLIGFFGGALGARVLGWGKPVRISLSPRSMTRRFSIKTSHLFIAAAGPMMNILFGLLLSGVFILLWRVASTRHLGSLVGFVIRMNIGLAFFNLIPCPPLDGGAILHGILPRSLEWISETLEKYGFIILLGLLMTGALRYLMIPAAMAGDWWMGLLAEIS
jgi:Zn-dependent protease